MFGLSSVIFDVDMVCVLRLLSSCVCVKFSSIHQIQHPSQFTVVPQLLSFQHTVQVQNASFTIIGIAETRQHSRVDCDCLLKSKND